MKSLTMMKMIKGLFNEKIGDLERDYVFNTYV